MRNSATDILQQELEKVSQEMMLSVKNAQALLDRMEEERHKRIIREGARFQGLNGALTAGKRDREE